MIENNTTHATYKQSRPVWEAMVSVASAEPLPCTAVVLLGVLTGLMPSIQVYATTGLINRAIRQTAVSGQHPHFHLSAFIPWLPILIGTVVATNVASAVGPYLGNLLEEAIDRDIKPVYFRKISKLPLAFLETSGTYDALERAGRGLSALTRLWSDMLRDFLTLVVGIVGLLTVFARVNFLMSVILVALSVPIARWASKSNKLFTEANYKQSAERRKLKYWADLLTGRENLPEIRLCGLEPHLLGRWRDASQALIARTLRLRTELMQTFALQALASYALPAATVMVLLAMARSGTLSVGEFVALVFAVQRYQSLIKELGNQLIRSQEPISHIHHLTDFLNMDLGEDLESGDPIPKIWETLTFEDVSFTYPGADAPALSHINLRIRSGERLALVGENGSGKTTLAKLILGVYQPTQGRICIDGLDIRTMNTAQWRSRTSVVFQDFMKYAFTVGDNVALGGGGGAYNLKELERACVKSGAANFVQELHGGYDCQLGKQFEDGHDISNGQWQKLAIARAYYRNPELLVLDEPTSALDAITEYELYRQFTQESHGKTVILISHRLGCARLADRILFMKSGLISEEGRHEDLLEAKGSYNELYKMQADWYLPDQSEHGSVCQRA